MQKLSGKYTFWDQATRTVVCPFNLHQSDQQEWEDFILRAEHLGLEVVGEIDMPLDFGYRFVVAKVPDWLSAERDDEMRDLWDFMDQKDRIRFRVIGNGVMMSTTIFTRYWPTDEIGHDFITPVVLDLEQPVGDDDCEAIWRASKKEIESIQPALFRNFREGQRWLDKNYPDWRNPSAYWS